MFTYLGVVLVLLMLSSLEILRKQGFTKLSVIPPCLFALGAIISFEVAHKPWLGAATLICYALMYGGLILMDVAKSRD